jgi:hypothetical protein
MVSGRASGQLLTHTAVAGVRNAVLSGGLSWGARFSVSCWQTARNLVRRTIEAVTPKGPKISPELRIRLQ